MSACTALEALAPFTAQLLQELAQDDYHGEQFAPRALPAAVQVFAWKDVRDEMPDDESTVLGYLENGEIDLVFHDGSMPDSEGNCWISATILGESAKVTHWAHLPEPPTRDAR